MATLLVKSLGVVGVAGASGLGGFGIYKAVSKNPTIKDTILNENSIRFHKFLNVDDSAWEGIKIEYDKSRSTDKPVGEDGKTVDKEFLPSWCDTAVNSVFKNKKDSKYRSVLEWCYINTNTFEAQVNAEGKQLVGEKEEASVAVSQSWKSFWTSTYKLDKEKQEWKITTGEDNGNLNGNDEASGASSLRKWCSSKLGVFMYVEEFRNDFKKFSRFCTKSQ